MKISVTSIIFATLLNAASFATASQIEGVLSPSRDVLIKTSVDGIIADTSAQEGTIVDTNTLLVKMIDEVQASKVDLAKTAAEATAEEQLAKTKATQADRKYRDLLKAKENGAATSWEVKDALATARAAKFEHALAKERILLDQKRLKHEEAILKKYAFTAPFKGEVVEISVTEGESVTRGDPIVRIVDTSILEIESYVPAEDFVHLEEGKTYSGSVPAPFNKSFKAELKHIDPVFEPATGAVRVVFRVQNTENLPAGATASIDLTLPVIMSLTPIQKLSPGKAQKAKSQ